MDIDWPDYLRVHTDRRNLLIHVFAVPLFIGAFILFPFYLFLGAYGLASIAALMLPVAMALQGSGHRMERNPPRPFSGPLNFLVRVIREQFIIFPSFVLSGRWWQQYRSGSGETVDDA
jgi:hypothetical protein